MIKFECETCFQEYKVRDDRAGQVLKCKSCGSKMRVPTGDDDFEDDLYEEEYEAPVRPARKKKSTGSSKKKSSNNSNNPITIIAGVCAFGIAFFIAYTFVGGLFGDKKNDEAAQQKIVDINQELKELRVDLKEYAEAVRVAKTKEERQPILDKMKTTLARVKELGEKQKAIIAANNKAKSNGNAASKNSSSTSQQWVSLIDLPTYSADWPESSNLSIDLKGIEEDKIVPHAFSPFIGLRHEGYDVYNIDVWNLVTEKKVGQVSIDIEKNWYVSQSKIKLSTDGKYMVLPFKTNDTKVPKVASWEVSTGKKLAEWDADVANNSIYSCGISNSTRVYTKTELRAGLNSKAFLKLWDLRTGKLLKEKEIDPLKFDNIHNKVSPGGKYLITLGTELGSVEKELVVYDLESLELINLTYFKDILQLKDKYFTLLEMNFSPDGKELGILLSNSNGTAIWLIDLKTGQASNGYQALSNISEVLSNPSYQGEKLVWHPSGTGWLLYGAWYLDRQRKKVLWTLKPVPYVIMRDEVYLTPHYLLAATATALSDKDGRLLLDQKQFLVPVQIPEKLVADDLAAYDSQDDAILAKGQQVSIDVNIGDVKFGNIEEVKPIIEDVIKQRLEAEGFKVTLNQPIILKIEYHEQDGNKLQLTKRGKPTPGNPLGRTATGKTIQSTAAAFKLSWIDVQSKKSLWTKEAEVNPRFLMLRNANAESARKQMFQKIQRRLMSENIPYFIPKDESLSILPVEIKLPE